MSLCRGRKVQNISPEKAAEDVCPADPPAAETELKTSGPGKEVVGIYELLEMILIELPLRDLLRSQAVSSQFKALFQTSESIRARFGLPFSTSLRSRDWTRHPMIPKEINIWAFKVDNELRVECRLHLKPESTFDWTGPGSWRCFFACQPGTRSIRAWSGCSKVWGSGSVGDYRYYVCAKGITLGQLVDIACEMRNNSGADEAIVHYETAIDSSGADLIDKSCLAYVKYQL